ncbi:MAG: glycosyltransferase [Bacteroidota bacterium]
MNTKKKIMFAYLKTGGGHLAPARALSNYINAEMPLTTATVLVDGLEKSNAFSKLVIEDGYRFLQNKANRLYEFIYLVHKIKPIAWISTLLMSINTKKYLSEMIKNEKPDTIVILHFFLIRPIKSIVKNSGRKIEVVSVVTDPFTPHPLWFLDKEQKFVVFSDRLKVHCIRVGIPEMNLKVLPFVVDQKYSKLADEKNKEALRTTFGFTNKKIVLILGGGDGMPNGEKIVKKLLRLNTKIEIAFVAGKNKEMFNNISLMKKKNSIERLKIFGFVDHIYELISVSDIIITKCGASTLMEILLSQKVPVVNRYLWEQEKGNVDFLLRHKMGIYERRIEKLAEEVERLIDEKDYYTKYVNNIVKQDITNGVVKVAEYILSL